MNAEHTACPNCGHPLIRKVGQKILTYKGHRFEWPNFTRDVCEECGESYVPFGSNKEFDQGFIAFKREVDGLLTPKQIRDIREKYCYTQEQFANKLQLASKTFARWETGKVAQSRVADHLLRILQNEPKVIRHILQDKKEAVMEYFESSEQIFGTITFTTSIRASEEFQDCQILYKDNKTSMKSVGTTQQLYDSTQPMPCSNIH